MVKAKEWEKEFNKDSTKKYIEQNYKKYVKNIY